MAIDYDLLKEILKPEKVYEIPEKKRSVIDDFIEREKERKEELERQARERDYRIRSGFFQGYR